MKLPFPSTRQGILEKFVSENLIVEDRGEYHITNLGGILFAKNLNHFEALSRKAVRVIAYEGKNRIKTLKDITDIKGYASGFEGLIEYINDKLPSNAEIGKALRKTVRMYPEIAVRELVANALPPFRHLILAALNTGMRKVEIYSLEWVNVNLEHNFITVTAQETPKKNTPDCHKQIAPGIASQTQSYLERQPVYTFIKKKFNQARKRRIGICFFFNNCFL